MDIYCPKCGEPLDMDELHYVDGKSFYEAKDIFFQKGCGFLGFTCQKRDTQAGELASVLYSVLGDDVDGMASMFDDLGGF